MIPLPSGFLAVPFFQVVGQAQALSQEPPDEIVSEPKNRDDVSSISHVSTVVGRMDTIRPRCSQPRG